MAKYSNVVEYSVITNVDSSGIIKLQNELTKLKQSLKFEKFDMLGFDQTKIDQSIKKVNQLQTALTAAFNPKIGTLDLSRLNTSLQKEHTSLQMIVKDWELMGTRGRMAISSLSNALLSMNKNAVTINTTLSKIANTFSNTVRWGITASIFQEMVSSVQGAVSYMKDLDESLTQIQMVTNSSKEDMRELAQYANNAAQALGSTTTDYTNAVKVFVQEGFSEKESKQYANLSTKLANVSEQNTSVTSDQITAFRNAFQLDYEQTVSAMDKVANVANNTASNVNELMTASQRAASVAQAVGSSQESFLAAIATIESVTRQSAEEIGNGLKTIYQRFADIKVSGTTEDGVDYGQYAKALKSIGVDVLDAAGEFKGMDQILKETQEVWSSLSDTMKIAVGEKVAGKFQYNRFAALMNNQAYYEKAYAATGADSEGMMDQMNEYYTESIEGRLKTLQAAGEQVMSTLFDQDAVEPVLEDVIHMVNGLNDLVDAAGGLTGVLQVLSALMLRTFSSQIASTITNMATSFQVMFANSRNAGQMSTAVNLFGLNNYAQSQKEGSLTAQLTAGVADKYDSLSANTREKLAELSKQLLEIEEQRNNALHEEENFMRNINNQIVDELQLVEENLAEYEKQCSVIKDKAAAGELTVKQAEKENAKLKADQQSLIKKKNLYSQIQQESAKYLRSLAEGKELTDNDIQAIKQWKEEAWKLNVEIKELTELLERANIVSNNISQAKKVIADTTKTVSLESQINGAAKGLSSITSVAFGFSMISEAIKTCTDESATFEEKLNAIVMNGAMGLTMLLPNLAGMAKGLKELTITYISLGKATELTATAVSKETAAEMLSNVTRKESISLTLRAIALKMQDIAKTIARTVSTTAYNVVAAIRNILDGNWVATAAAIVAVAGIAIIRIAMLTKAWLDNFGALAQAKKGYEEQKAVLSSMKKDYSDLVDAISELSSTMDDIKKKEDAFKGLTRGTTEWKQAVAELNKEILALLENYPELSSYVTSDEGGALKIDEEGLDTFYNSQLDKAKKLSEATLVQQNKVYEQSNKLAIAEFAQKYSVGLFGNDVASIEAAIKEGKDGIDQLNLTTQSAQQDYYKLLQSVDKNTLAINTNNDLIGQSNNYISYATIDSNEANETAARNNVLNKYTTKETNWLGVASPITNFLTGGSKNLAGVQIKNSEVTKEALAEALGTSSSKLTIKKSDLDNITYQIEGEEERTESVQSIIEKLESLERVTIDSAEKIEKDRALYEKAGAVAVKLDGTVAKAGEAFDHFEKGGRVINDLMDLNLNGLTRTNKYGMTAAETAENLQLEFGISEQSAADLHDRIQKRIDAEGAFELQYDFEDADKAIKEDELFGKSSMEQLLDLRLKEQMGVNVEPSSGRRTLEYLTKLNKALGEEVDAFTLLTDKTLNTRLEMIRLEEATNNYNQTINETQNNAKSYALDRISNQVSSLGIESERADEGLGQSVDNAKLKQLLDSVNEEDSKLLASLGIEYNGYEDISIDEVTNQIRESLLQLSEEDFTISIEAITNLDDTTEDIINSLENVTSAVEKVNDDFTVSYSDLEDVVAAFPGILGENEDAYTVYADGSIQLNSEIAQAAIDAAQTDKNATINAQIEKIESQKVAVAAAIAGYQAEIDAAVEKNNTIGISEEEKEKFVYESSERIAEYNDALAEASIEASRQMSLAAQQSELEQQAANAQTTDQAAENDQIIVNNFAQMLQTISSNIGSFISAVIGPLGSAIVSAFAGKPIEEVVSGVVFGGGLNIQSAVQSSGAPSTQVSPYTKFGGLDGYIEYLEQDRKILEQTENTLNAHEAKLRAMQGKSAQQSDVANRPSKNGGGSNGGGDKGSNKNNQEKEGQRSEWDYLTDITNDLERAAAIMERLAKLEDRLYGANRVSQLKTLQKQYQNRIKLLNQEVKLEEKHAKKLRNEGYDENGNLTISGYAHRAGISKLKFDGQNNLENGREIEQALLQKVNQATAAYNDHRNSNDAAIYDEKLDHAKNDYDGFLKALSEYESTLGKIEEGQSEIQDYKEKIQDAADAIVDSIQKGIEDVLKAMDSQREFNRMYRDWQEGGNSYSHFSNSREYYTEGLESLLSKNNGESIFDTQLESLNNRIKDVEDVFDLDKKDKKEKDADDEKLSQQAAFENLQEATSNVMDSLNKMIDYYDSLLETIQEASDKMDELIDDRLKEFDRLEKYLDTRLDQLALLFGDKSYKEQAQLYNQKIAVNMEKMVSINTAIEQKQTTVDTLLKLEATGKKLSTEERKELQDAREKVNELQEEQLSTETKLLQDISDKLKAQTSAEMNKLVNSLFNDTDVDWLSEQWEIATRNSEKYLDDYNRAFELQKLQLKFQEALNDSQNSSLATQQKIVALGDEYLTYLREKNNLSEYDVKHAQMELDILQKQIALEDARNNKSQMQLQRNAAGNYDFVYAADENAVNQAAEALLAAQQESYNLSKKMYLDTYQSAFEAATKTKEMVVQIATDASLSVEERAERIKFVLDNLNEYLSGSSVELGEISLNLYNSFAEAEQLIAEENQGNLSAIFEQMREDFTALVTEINQTLEDSKETSAAISESLIGTAESTSSTIGDSVNKTTEGIASAFGNMATTGSENFGKLVSSITSEEGDGGHLQKIKKGVVDKADEIHKYISDTTLANIDKRFGTSEEAILSTVGNIDSKIKEAINNITGAEGKPGYLGEFESKTQQALSLAKDSYTDFTENSINYANEQLEVLRESTQYWQNDLNNLNEEIKNCAGQMAYWKKQVDGAISSAAVLITNSNTLQKNLGTVASQADQATNALEGVGYAADYTASASFVAADACYAVAEAANSAAGSARDAANAYREMAAAAAEAALQKSISDSYRQTVDEQGNIVYHRSGGATFASGGYTGKWSDNGINDKNGKWAILHQKELVLNATDTENMLSAIEIVRDIMSGINSLSSIGKMTSQNSYNNAIEQRVEISATFPGVTEAIEIKQALEQLADNAYQAANKYKY